MAEEPKDAEAGAQGTPSAKMEQKVELDLDDAPFLEDDLEPEPEPEPEKKDASSHRPDAPVTSAKGEATLKDRLSANKKKLVMAAGGAVVLLLMAVLVNVFLFSGEPEPAPPAPEEPETVTVAPKTMPPAPSPQFSMRWEPFWVELKDTEGAIRYLTLRFSVPTDNPNVFAEMNIKKLILRDALFYYLRNQPIVSLSDEARVQAFKGELLTVINEHLGSGKVNEVLIEEYLVQ